MITAAEKYAELQKRSSLTSHFSALDDLLGGGFIEGPIYLLSGHSHICSNLLMNLAVNSLVPNEQSFQAKKVAYVDGYNQFDPYMLAKLVAQNRLNIQEVLRKIVVSRSFTWHQMVELLEERIKSLEDVDLILVAGFTAMFEENLLNQENQSESAFQPKIFHELKRMFQGLNKVIEMQSPLIILSGPLNTRSLYRPAGGSLVSHYCGVHVNILETEHYYQLILEQHPFLAHQSRKIWKHPSLPRQHLASIVRNHSLDDFMK